MTPPFASAIGETVRSISVLPTPHTPNGPVVLPELDNWLFIKILKIISERQIIGSSLVSLHERSGLAIVKDLAEHLLALLLSVSHHAGLPSDLRRYYMMQGQPVADTTEARRAVVDFICTLTDSQAEDLRNKLMGFTFPAVPTEY